MSAQIPSTMRVKDLLKPSGYDCPEELLDKTFEEATSGGDTKISTNTEATIDVSQYTEPIEITPAEGYDATKKVTAVLTNIPSGADIEANHETTIDVSTYTEPVEVTPTAGKDGMAKNTITLSNIPSGGSITLNTLLPGLGSNENVVYGAMFLDTNLQPITIDDFETFDFSQVTHLYMGEEYSVNIIPISNLSYNREARELTYTSNGSEGALYVSADTTSTVDYPLIDYLSKSFE